MIVQGGLLGECTWACNAGYFNTSVSARPECVTCSQLKVLLTPKTAVLNQSKFLFWGWFQMSVSKLIPSARPCSALLY